MRAIVTGADYKYLPGVIALYNSIKINANISYDIYLLAHGNPEDFENLPKDIKVIYNKETITSPTSSEWPIEIPAMYSRLLIPDLFSEYDKVLWLDADTIVLKDLNPLFDLDLQDYPCAGALPSHPTGPAAYNLMPFQLESAGIYPKLEKIPSISAGVVLFNIPRWKELNLDKKVNEVLESNIKFKFVVQGLLGYVLEGNFKQIDCTWNFCANWIGFKHIKDINILHYIGGKAKSPWSHKMPQQDLWNHYYNYET